MSIAIVYSRATTGIKAPLITVEAHISNGLPRFSIVGLPETTVKESKERVRSAIINSRFEFPGRRITINLAPAELPKEGSRFDLPIALGILAATGQIPRHELDSYEFAGELALSGAMRPIHGVLPFVMAARQTKRRIIIPTANSAEAVIVTGCTILPAEHLLEVCAHLCGGKQIPEQPCTGIPSIDVDLLDIADVRGQQHAKRTLEIAAAGGHSLLMYGPPGTGKSMLAARLPSILPVLTETEALELAAVISISHRKWQTFSMHERPFRAPHHTASSPALVGGSSPPRPGEISLAHHGILFLDELPEFDRRVLEALREPLENGTISIARAAMQVDFPARFQLVAAMNPCPCGYLGDTVQACRCTCEQIKRYRGRISGPLLDRIDMHIEIARLPDGLLTKPSTDKVESSAMIRARVNTARNKQLERCGVINAALKGQQLEKICFLTAKDGDLLENAIKKFGLSARAYHRILRVARTIADLSLCEQINTAHLIEALSFRNFDRSRHV